MAATEHTEPHRWHETRLYRAGAELGGTAELAWPDRGDSFVNSG